MTGVAVRVIIAARVAGDLRTWPAGGGTEMQIVHRHEDAPLRRLEAVAGIGQGSADDHAHRVGQIARPELVLDIEQLNPAASLDWHIVRNRRIIRTRTIRQENFSLFKTSVKQGILGSF